MKKLFTLLLLAAVPFVGQAEESELETVVIGAGCFWCLEAIYEAQPGVTDVVSGFAGGSEKNPTYKKVSYGKTSHAEVIEITFDPSETSLVALMDIFWKTFDPTDGRGVEPDFGEQYRHILLWANDAQKQVFEKSLAEEQKSHSKPIKTEIQKLVKFYPAEEYHQDFVKRNPNNRYVRAVSYPRMDLVGVKHK